MKFLKTSILIVGLLVLGVVAVSAQTFDSHNITFDITAFSVIALNDTTVVDLSVTPAAPGAVITGDTDNTKYLLYPVLTGATTQEITVTAATVTGGIPAGTALSVVASGLTGNEGSATAAVTLTTGMANTNIITGISSVATGTGVGDGAQLTYAFTITDETQVTTAEDNNEITVTYTITEN